MKKYRCYLRAVLLSVVAAFIIDTILHFEDYRAGWVTGFSRTESEPADYEPKTGGSANAGKVTSAVFDVFSSL